MTPSQPTPPDRNREEIEALLQRPGALIWQVRIMLWKLRALQLAAVLLSLLALALPVYLVGLEVKNWLYGKTHTYRFSGVLAPQRTRKEFESDFTQRLTEQGYQVGSLRVTYENHLHQFNGEITLINVPTSTSDSDVRQLLREVSGSLKDKSLPVEK